MESALYGIFTLAGEVSEISLVWFQILHQLMWKSDTHALSMKSSLYSKAWFAYSRRRSQVTARSLKPLNRRSRIVCSHMIVADRSNQWQLSPQFSGDGSGTLETVGLCTESHSTFTNSRGMETASRLDSDGTLFMALGSVHTRFLRLETSSLQLLVKYWKLRQLWTRH